MMKMTLLVACVMALPLAEAQTPDPVPVPGMMAPPQGPGAQNPQAATVETVADTTRRRDPFWPVGFVPKVVRKVPDAKGHLPVPANVVPELVRAPQWDEARKKLDIRGISLIGREKESGQPRFVAMVAGKLVEEGDVVAVTHEDRIYRWKVVGISTAGISFQKLDMKPE